MLHLPTHRLSSLLLAGLALLASAGQASAQLRVVTYNTANASSLPRDGVSTVLSALGDQAKAGFARPIDILTMQEQQSVATTTQAYVDLLNGLYGAGTYARGK